MTPADMDAEQIDPPLIDPEELRDTARRFIADKVDRRAGWGASDQPDTAALVAEMADLGWLLLSLPDAQGGLGQPFSTLAVVYEELGRAVANVDLAESLATAELLASDPAWEALVGAITTGQARVAVVFGKKPVVGDRLPDVIGAPEATHLLLVDDQANVSILDLREGATIIPAEAWDHSRSIGDIEIKREPVPVGGDGHAVRAHLELAIAWDCIGGAQQILEESIAYMATRHQFGRPIGSFQALKHRAADLKVQIEVARALAERASLCFATRGEEWEELATQAKLLATSCYALAAEEGIQFHGGIGVTWEHDCHLFLKRAFLNQARIGNPEDDVARIAPRLMRRAMAEGKRSIPSQG